jgi:hypothetical protein
LKRYRREFLALLFIFASSFFLIHVVYSSKGDIIWVQTSNPSDGFDVAYSVAVDGSGVYITGIEIEDSEDFIGIIDFKWRIEKRDLMDGSLLWEQTSNPSLSLDMAYGVAVDGSGVYIIGYDEAPELGAGITGFKKWRIEKRSLNDGTIIWNRTKAPEQGYGIALAVAVDDTGLYTVGSDQFQENDTFTTLHWRIEKRDLMDGSLLWNKTGNPATLWNAANSVTSDDSGLYIVGMERAGEQDFQWRIEKRDLVDGSLLWNQTNNPSEGLDMAYSVTIDTSGIYVVGRDNSTENDAWRIEKRNLTDGSILWLQTNNPSNGYDAANSVAVDGSGVYIAGSDNSTDDFAWRIEKRSLDQPTNGNLTPEPSPPAPETPTENGIAGLLQKNVAILALVPIILLVAFIVIRRIR